MTVVRVSTFLSRELRWRWPSDKEDPEPKDVAEVGFFFDCALGWAQDRWTGAPQSRVSAKNPISVYEVMAAISAPWGLDWEEFSALVVTVIGLPLLPVVIIWLIRGGVRDFGEPALRRCFQGIRIHQSPEPGDVCFRYHTYRGLLWTTQEEHRVIAPPEDAELLLRRLLQYNLTWGLLCDGKLFVLFLALGNYFAQKRWIRQQALSAGPGVK